MLTKLIILFSCVSFSYSTPYRKVRVCEDEYMIIGCHPGATIDIKSANYGRTQPGSHVCPKAALDYYSTCHSSNSMSIVMKECQKQRNCKIHAHNNVFGDPCEGTFKYLEVEYACIKFNEIACEGSTLDIGCENGEVINIETAIYGRKFNGSSLCPQSGHDLDTNCISSKSLEVVKNKCENKQICSVRASNQMFEDPCVGTHKYLDIVYKCTKSDQDSDESLKEPTEVETVCEHKSLKLRCEPGAILYIKSANYGRTVPGSKLCPQQGNDYFTNCQSSNSLDIVKKTCQKKNSCEVLAENVIFGDPCFKTFKYLEVKYSCRKNDTIACEHSTLEISCEDDENDGVINIHSANYGRTANGSIVCPAQGLDQYTECTSSNSLKIVKDLCENKKSCSIFAKNEVFGDPCYNTFKYLEVDWTCANEVVTVCEHESLKLRCEPGAILYIKSANYGRTVPGSQLCPQQGIDYFTNCHSSNSLDIVKKACQKKNSCEVLAENKIFGDPCINTFKYLEVEYSCRKINKIACEHSTLEISCEDDENDGVINIHSANYGRTVNGSVCPAQGQDQYTECTSSNSLKIVKDLCENKKSCSILAKNEVFGDPCYNTFKYLEVDWTCAKVNEVTEEWPGIELRSTF